MKKTNRILSALLCALLLTSSLAACTGAPAQGTEAPTEQSSEPATNNPDSEIPTVQGAIDFSTYAPGGATVVSGETSAPVYKENITTANGSALIESNIGVRLDYTSTFYGHDSAINRDYVQYGWNYQQKRLSLELPTDGFGGSFNGDFYDDIVRYENGELQVIPLLVTTGSSSVFATKDSTYALGDPILYSVGITAQLRGTGDFDNNGYTDVLFAGEDGALTLGLFGLSDNAPLTILSIGKMAEDAGDIYTGDVDGDGYCDIITVKGTQVAFYYNQQSLAKSDVTATPFLYGGEKTPAMLPQTGILMFAVADINADKRADLVFITTNESGNRYVTTTLFGRGAGVFGPTAEETENTNLYATFSMSSYRPLSLTLGDFTGDGVVDVMLKAERSTSSLVNLLLINQDDTAYDYSIFGMKTDDGYRIYAGGRWFDQSGAVKDSTNGEGTGDGDHVLMYFSDDGVTWQRYLDGPAFYLGWETGESGWWTTNTLEPEVILIDGVYHMFWQCSGPETNDYYSDYLGYASSTDGIHFIRKTDSPIVVPTAGALYTDFTERIGFNHEEILYVPDDPDGKCFWLYTGHFINNGFQGYVRIRSADPTCFCWDEREATTGFSQIGNQMAYLKDYDGCGNNLYLRITFADNEEKTNTVPTLQVSADGLNFVPGGMLLASTDLSDPITENNRNVYFLGFCTINGTGEVERNEDGSYRLVYFATTSAGPGAPEIFAAEAGVGVLDFKLVY